MQWSCLKLPWGAWRFWGPPKWQISTGFGGQDFFGAKKSFFGGYQKLKTIFGYSRSRKKKLQVAPKNPRIYKTSTDLLEIATHRECRFAAHNSFFVALPNVDVSPGNPRFIEREAPPEAVQGDTDRTRTRRFCEISLRPLELGQQMGVSMQTVQELW